MKRLFRLPLLIVKWAVEVILAALLAVMLLLFLDAYNRLPPLP